MVMNAITANEFENPRHSQRRAADQEKRRSGHTVTGQSPLHDRLAEKYDSAALEAELEYAVREAKQDI
jgi:hypothetical protein